MLCPSHVQHSDTFSIAPGHLRNVGSNTASCGRGASYASPIGPGDTAHTSTPTIVEHSVSLSLSCSYSRYGANAGVYPSCSATFVAASLHDVDAMSSARIGCASSAVRMIQLGDGEVALSGVDSAVFLNPWDQ